MGKLSLALACLLVAAACNSRPPNDVSEGVGFNDYGSYSAERAARQAQLRGEPPQSLRAPDADTSASAAVPTAAGTDSVTARAAAAIAEAETGPTETATAQIDTNNPDISDEQNFEAVAARESIESDAERREQMQEQLVIVQPTALPDRPGSTGPNIIEYALSTSHPVGEARHSRSPFRQGRHEANCLAYRSDDLAQEAFLSLGGPERDRQALDPDGDGYACGWNPTVYRNAAQAARGN
ncbi:hypothetical protein E2K80_10505 [Rhodophyticola sp. CCM32]|uniref:hypothetical protein n=1 Tax=Rhodophyticola sp. CCM32 TaxID=2916397 RepID=UPI00107F5E9B|nr:hypothetical protein [Rhodophyticola sp. CCM32]QBY01107.1 hypothetical protein E2K80_10505 [Rhodophyticola sp. CCM32]